MLPKKRHNMQQVTPEICERLCKKEKFKFASKQTRKKRKRSIHFDPLNKAGVHRMHWFSPFTHSRGAFLKYIFCDVKSLDTVARSDHAVTHMLYTLGTPE